jgi:hypothetical protein
LTAADEHQWTRIKAKDRTRISRITTNDSSWARFLEYRSIHSHYRVPPSLLVMVSKKDQQALKIGLLMEVLTADGHRSRKS